LANLSRGTAVTAFGAFRFTYLSLAIEGLLEFRLALYWPLTAVLSITVLARFTRPK
jgi:hypothetical protein